MKMETIATVNTDNSSITKTLNHLFYYEDSFLNFKVKENNSFKLGNLVNFDSDAFEMLQFPLDWLTRTVNNDGIKVSVF